MVQKSCLQDTNCCLTSQPCLNSGVCKPTYPSDILHSPRFQCDCAPGYRGNKCEQPIKSCREHYNNSKIPAFGIYTIIDNNNKPFRVFCHFSPDRTITTETIAWTLVQSFKLENEKNFRKSFTLDHPKNPETPNWTFYRLSKSRMEFIQRDSSKWRMTCRFETDGLIYTDYMEGLKTQVDILQYTNAACKEVEFINVRGYNGTKCKAYLRQNDLSGDRPAFHHKPKPSIKHCTFKPKKYTTCDNRTEFSFGHYKCVNPAHRCSTNSSSTTQSWLGSNVH